MMMKCNREKNALIFKNNASELASITESQSKKPDIISGSCSQLTELTMINQKCHDVSIKQLTAICGLFAEAIHSSNGNYIITPSCIRFSRKAAMAWQGR